jgi:hypothetical protein
MAASPTIADGELGSPDFEEFLIDPDVDIAPNAPVRTAMLASIPFPYALDLNAGAGDQQVQWLAQTPVGDVHFQGLLAPRQRAEVMWSAAAPCRTALSS